MSHKVLIVGGVVVLGVVLGFFVFRGGEQDPTLLEQLAEEQNTTLFPVNENETFIAPSDFTVGAPYLIFASSGPKQLQYIGAQESTGDALFQAGTGQIFSFDGTVMFSLRDTKDNKDIDKLLEEINLFSLEKTGEQYRAQFTTPYEAYLFYLGLREDGRLTNIGLDLIEQQSTE